MKKAALVFVLFMMFGLVGCSSTSKKNAETADADPLKNEQQLAEDMNHNIEASFGAWKDPRVENYVQSLVTRLISNDTTLRDKLSGVRVRLLNTDVPLIGAGLAKTILLSRGVLNSVEYESELAFVLSSAILLMRDQYPQKKYLAERSDELQSKVLVLPMNPQGLSLAVLDSGWYERGGFFDFGYDAYFKAEQEAIRVVQSSHFDHRGAVSLLKNGVQSHLLIK